MKTFLKHTVVAIVWMVMVCSCGPDTKPVASQKNKPAEAIDMPVLTLLNRRIELGKVKKDSSVTGKYYFTNTGNKKLVIEYVNPDCSCTGFYLTKQEIEPGDSSCLVLKMSTKNKEGNIQINATISANTPTHFYKVSLLAEVI